MDGSAAAAIAVMAPGPLTAILVPFLGRKSNKKYEKLQTGIVTMAVLSMKKGFSIKNKKSKKNFTIFS